MTGMERMGHSMTDRFGDAWNTLDPGAHGFGNEEEMTTAAKGMGFSSPLQLQRNNLLMKSMGKDTLAQTASANALSGLPSGSMTMDYQRNGGAGRSILGPYGAGSNDPDAAVGTGGVSGLPEKMTVTRNFAKPVQPRGTPVASTPANAAPLEDDNQS